MAANFCLQCKEEQLDATGYCKKCDCIPGSTYLGDVYAILCQLRATIFAHLNQVPRHNTSHKETHITEEAFDCIFAGTGAEELIKHRRRILDGDDEPALSRKRVVVRSFEGVARFASFHCVKTRKTDIMPGAYQAAKVLSSGEVVVLIPPLQATWSITDQAGHKMSLRVSWALLNAGLKASHIS